MYTDVDLLQLEELSPSHEESTHQQLVVRMIRLFLQKNLIWIIG